MKEMVRNGWGGEREVVVAESLGEPWKIRIRTTVIVYGSKDQHPYYKVQDPEQCFQQTLSFLMRATFLYELKTFHNIYAGRKDFSYLKGKALLFICYWKKNYT
jgi:hypothetical protein